MRFQFIQAHARIFHVVTMCQVLEVSKAGYYAWCARPLCERVKEDRRLSERIRQIQAEVKQRYGRPRVRAELRALGFPCGKNRIARLLKAEGLNAKHARQFRVTTRSDDRRAAAPNQLDRNFAVAPAVAPNQVWTADITYLPTREGWLYLAVILDLATRRVVGWALRTRLEQELALSALHMALTHRQARGGLHHSDRGVQYTSTAYRQALAAAGFTSSMSRRGNCWDNAVTESFFATLTKELLLEGVFATRAAASAEVFSFIEIWYNRRRRHSALGYKTPAEFEAMLEPTLATAG
jgi:putative transposase